MISAKTAVVAILIAIVSASALTVPASGETVASVTQYSYDANLRLRCTAERMNPAVFASLPDACTLAVEGSQGPDRITRNGYDTASQLLTIQKAVGTPLEQNYATYSYTVNGKQSTVRDANGNLTTYAYDAFDRLAQWSFPDRVSVGLSSSTDFESYSYDANGNMTTFRKRDGRAIANAYDALNRLTSKTVPDSCVNGFACTNVPAAATRDVFYNYDLANHQIGARFDSASGSDGVFSSWDALGRQMTSTTTMGSLSRSLAYQYDSGGNRVRITWPDGMYVTVNFDAANHAVSFKQNGSIQVASIAYDSLGRRASDARLATVSGYGYDAFSRLVSLSDDLAGTASDLTTTLTYNGAGQIATRARTNVAYAFGSYMATNRSYSINGLNQYSSVAAAPYGYDSNGNLTSDGITSYTYDAENRLVSTGNGAALTYDALGRLYSTYSPSTGLTTLLYDGDALVGEYSGSSIARRYVHGESADDPIIWYEGSDLSSPRSLQIDTQGSVVSVADGGGNVLRVNSYDEYGTPVTGGSGNIGRFQYTGQAWIPELRMYYYKARIYSSMIGRFLQTDPIGYKDQLNLYSYVANDPVNGRDPDGTDTVYNFPGLKIIYVPIVNMSDRPDAEILRNMRIDGVDSSHTRIEVRPVLAKQIDSVSVRTDGSLRDTNPDGARRSHTDSIGGREILLAPGSGAKTEKHEFGHTLGAGDQYGGGVDAQGRTLRQDVPGSQGSLMGRGAGTTPNQQTINEISRNASTSPRNTQMTCSATVTHVDCR